MAVAFDAAVELERTDTSDPAEWTHVPVGTPRGIIVTAVHNTSTTDHVSTVTYGGVAMARIQRAVDTATELGAAEIWFLGSGIPTGNQTVSANLATGTAEDIHFVSISVTADKDTEVVDSDAAAENQANPSLTLQYGGRTCLAVAALYGGGAAPTSFEPNANCTTVADVDFGATYSEVIRQTTPGTADFAIGGTSASDDVAFVALAVSESTAVTGTGSLAVAPALAGTGTTPKFADQRQAIINGLDSAQSEANGWDAVVKAGIAVGDVVRTSDTIVTITLPAFGTYEISAQETITVTVPAAALKTGTNPIVASPTFTVDPSAAGVSGTGDLAFAPALAAAGIVGVIGTGALAVAMSMSGTGSQPVSGSGDMAVPMSMAGTGIVGNIGSGDIAVALTLSGTGSQPVSGSGDLAVSVTFSGSGADVLSGTGDLALTTPSLSGTSPFAAVRAAIIAGIDSAQSEATGWDALRSSIPDDAVVRTSDTVVTITLPALATYNITANETLSVTVPGSALTGAAQIVATPTFDITAGASSGSMAVAAPAMSGTGTQVFTGTGSMAIASPAYLFGDNFVVPLPSFSGTGTTSNPVSGSSTDFAIPAFTLAATGTQVNTGTGDLALASPALSGTSDSAVTGTGSLAVGTPALAATGTQEFTGTGDLAVTLTLSGTGTQTFTGTGSLAVTLVLDGTGVVANPVTGTGDMAVALVLDGDGTMTSSRRRGKYKGDHAGALESVNSVGDFAEDHASVLLDITDAGV